MFIIFEPSTYGIKKHQNENINPFLRLCSYNASHILSKYMGVGQKKNSLNGETPKDIMRKFCENW